MAVVVTVEDIKKRLLSYQEYGTYLATCCPFHDDAKPSLMVYYDGWFRCLACGKSGDFYLLYRTLQGWMPPTIKTESVVWHPPHIDNNLEEMCIYAHEVMLEFEVTLGWYLRLRGLEGRIIPCQLGWKDGWITIPVYNPDHTWRGVTMRACPHVQKVSGARFFTPPDQNLELYIPDQVLVHNSEYLVVVYGIFDALTLSELRIPVATGCAGKVINPEFFDRFRRPILVIPDLGEEEEALKLASSLGARGLTGTLPYPSGCKDPNDYLQKGLRDQLERDLQRLIVEKRLR